MPKGQIKNSSVLQQEISTVMVPISSRHNYYATARKNIAKSIGDYFFIEANNQKIKEVMGCIGGYPVPALVSKELLNIDFQSLTEFTDIMLQAGLGLKLEGEFFAFNHTEVDGLEKDTLIFMRKLTYALTALRICYGIELVYDLLLQHEHVQTESYQSYLPQIQQLITDYEAGNTTENLADHTQSYYFQAKKIQKEIEQHHNQINQAKESFTECTQMAVATICEGLNKVGSLLIKANSEFPDQTWFGDGWSPFIIGLLKEIFSGYYSYAWLVSGSVSINENYFGLLTTELANYSMTMQDQMEHLKLALLREAGNEVNSLISTIQADASLHQVILTEQSTYYREPSFGLMFSGYLNALNRERTRAAERTLDIDFDADFSPGMGSSQ
ncbi:hypothetical protein [Legionella shakespearei]|uniref:Coiled-coil protein n=1 Tax=Legionella shakespearei DSM 23087 TaxID=1122169 RepID=A0A0W0YKU3_9GAMM|nr:hypothetical protein [Legionella shakespearei]KTD57514.1 hypothetical protein Lsha_2355 [Legionella shakespearei DSM 23087]